MSQSLPRHVGSLVIVTNSYSPCSNNILSRSTNSHTLTNTRSPLMHTHTHTHTLQCSVEMQQILRLALRDGDEWVRLFATILAPFPHSQSIDVEPCTEGNMEGVQAEVAEACMFYYCIIKGAKSLNIVAIQKNLA